MVASAQSPPKSEAQRLYETALAALQKGDGPLAESGLRDCLAGDPNHVLANLQLGVLLTGRRAFADAEPLLRHAVELNSALETVSALAHLFEQTGRASGAEGLYQDILRAIPNHAPTLIRLGAIAEGRGDRRGARAYYKKGWDADPKNIGAGIHYGLTSFADDTAETSSVLTQLLAVTKGDESAQITILEALIIYKEFHERIKRGLMPYHATSLDELFFTYAADDFALFRDLSFKRASAAPADVSALIRKFTALFCSRDRRGAQACVEQFAKAVPGHIWETVTFDPAYYARLETFTDAQLTDGLPPVDELISADFADEHVAYLSCNYAYVPFAAPMIRSLADKSPGAQIHLHIMDANADERRELVTFCRSMSSLKIGLTVESPGVDKKGIMAARSYYHAIRFIRYYADLQRYRRTLWLMDVDALFNRDPHEMYRVLGDKDAAMRIRAGRLEPWNQFNACIVAATPKPSSLLYFRMIAAYIADFYRRDMLRWGIDQLAMYGVFEHLRDRNRAPSLAFLDDRAIDYDYRDDGIVWCNSGKNKFFHLNRNPDGSLVIDDPDRAKYIKLFDKYYRP